MFFEACWDADCKTEFWSSTDCPFPRLGNENEPIRIGPMGAVPPRLHFGETSKHRHIHVD